MVSKSSRRRVTLWKNRNAVIAALTVKGEMPREVK
jgi:hypothetical protein